MSATEAPVDAGQRALTRRAGLVALGTLCSRVFGLARELVLAALFTRAATDAFFVAFLIPNVLRQLLAEGAVQTGVLPVLAEVQEKQGPKRAREFFRAVRGLGLLVLGLVSVAGVLAAPALVHLFAGGYRDEPGLFETTVELTRWVFPYIFFMGAAALGMAALNSQGRYAVTAFAPALLNIAFIACAFALPAWLEGHGLEPLHALSLGVLLGGILQVVVQWPSLRAVGYHGWPRLDLRDPDVRRVLKRMSPVLLGFGIYYLDVVVARHLLSTFELGAQSYFAFAMRLCDFPQGIFVMAVQAAALPVLSRLAARQDYPALQQTLNHGVRLSLFVGLPASLALMVLAEPLVTLIYQRGHFDSLASVETASALRAQASGIWAVAVARQLVVGCYALGNTRAPVWISALDFVVFVAVALGLMGSLGHSAVGWAMSVSSVVQVLLLGWVLRQQLGSLDVATTLRAAAKVGVASTAAGAAGYGVIALLRDATLWGWTFGSSSGLLAGLGLLVFGLVFLAFAVGLRCGELRVMTSALSRRLAPRS